MQKYTKSETANPAVVIPAGFLPARKANGKATAGTMPTQMVKMT